MISKETCYKIWNAWNEIEKSEILITDMKKAYKETGSTDLDDSFGRPQGITLGVPSGHDSHRIFGVPLDLSVKIIEAHIENQKKKLEELKAIATIELKG